MRAVVVSVCVLAACGRIGFDATRDGSGTDDANVVIDGGVFVGTNATYVKASNTGVDDNFGGAIALSDDGRTLAIAAFNEASGSMNQNDNTAGGAGAVYVFTRGPDTWVQEDYIKAPAPQAGDTFGTGVALSADGNVLAIGALGEDSSSTGVDGPMNENAMDSGAAYIYRRTGSDWSLEAFIKPSNTDIGDGFGTSVALSGDGTVLVVGAPNEDANGPNIGQGDNSATSAGAAYVYVNRGGWAFAAYLKAKNASGGDFFGDSLAISRDGSTIVVGAYFEASSNSGIDPVGTDNASLGAGAAYVFDRSGDNWIGGPMLKSSNAEAGDQFGTGIALSANGTILVVGGHLEDSNARSVNGSQTNNDVNQAGAAYVLEKIGGTWMHRAYLKASNNGTDYNFGLRCSISADGSEIAVGSINEASASSGVNGDQNDTSMFGAGAAYVFSRGADTRSWSQRAYVKAITPGPLDNFATVVLSADGRTLVVGAYLEDSSATGIDGNSNDDSRMNSGAAYIYE